MEMALLDPRACIGLYSSLPTQKPEAPESKDGIHFAPVHPLSLYSPCFFHFLFAFSYRILVGSQEELSIYRQQRFSAFLHPTTHSFSLISLPSLYYRRRRRRRRNDATFACSSGCRVAGRTFFQSLSTTTISSHSRFFCSLPPRAQ